MINMDFWRLKSEIHTHNVVIHPEVITDIKVLAVKDSHPLMQVKPYCRILAIDMQHHSTLFEALASNMVTNVLEQ